MIIKIGKAKDNDFIANDPHVSRYHARLIREDGGNLLLEDTGSTNGTFVNGAQIVKKRVTPTDHIRLGDSYVLNLSEVLKYNNDYSDEFAALKKSTMIIFKQKLRFNPLISLRPDYFNPYHCFARNSGGRDRLLRER